MKVFVALGDCGDYYCDGEHFLGVYADEESAKDRVMKYQKAHKYNYGGGHFGIEIGEHNTDHPAGLDL